MFIFKVLVFLFMDYSIIGRYWMGYVVFLGVVMGVVMSCHGSGKGICVHEKCCE